MCAGDHAGQRNAPLELELSCRASPTGGATVTVTVNSRVDLPLLPSALGGSAPSFRLDSTHSVPLGRYKESPGAVTG